MSAHNSTQPHVSLSLQEKASYKVESLSELSPDLVGQLLEHFVDPVHGSPSKGRKTVGLMSLYVQLCKCESAYMFICVSDAYM